MSKERELLKRVLIGDDDGDFFLSHGLYKELQELLAQPEQTEQDQIFKLIEKNRFNEGLMIGLESSNRTLIASAEAKQNYLNENERLTNLLLEAEDKIQELLAQPEQTEQEPVAVGYIYKQKDCYGLIETVFNVDKPHITWHNVTDVTPVYTAPPKREPLSLEELCKLYGDNVVEDIFAFARAIEKAHGIGVDDE